MSIHGILGEQTTDYPTEYSPETCIRLPAVWDVMPSAGKPTS